MEHSMNELFHIVGKPGVYDSSYLDAFSIFEREYSSDIPKGFAYRVNYLTCKKELKVHTAGGSKVVYPVGEKRWFDTEEEREVERAEREKIRAANAHRRELLKKLDDRLTTKQLEKLIEKLGL